MVCWVSPRRTEGYETVPVDGARFEPVDGRRNALRPVWRDGYLLADRSLTQIRHRAAEFDSSV